MRYDFFFGGVGVGGALLPSFLWLFLSDSWWFFFFPPILFDNFPDRESITIGNLYQGYKKTKDVCE